GSGQRLLHHVARPAIGAHPSPITPASRNPPGPPRAPGLPPGAMGLEASTGASSRPGRTRRRLLGADLALPEGGARDGRQRRPDRGGRRRVGTGLGRLGGGSGRRRWHAARAPRRVVAGRTPGRRTRGAPYLAHPGGKPGKLSLGRTRLPAGDRSLAP